VTANSEKKEDERILEIQKQIESFQTTPVTFELHGVESVNNKRASVLMTAFTTDRVTGLMPAVNWKGHAANWDHLKGMPFPKVVDRQIIDVLIGSDTSDLHLSLQDVHGDPGDPIASLTPLGWTCVGRTEPNIEDACPQTYFSQTEVLTDPAQQLDSTMRRFWEIENPPAKEEVLVLRAEDQTAMAKVRETLKFVNGRYQIGVPWKENAPQLGNNHALALRRLQNTEERLAKDQEVSKMYADNLGQYLQKGYIREVPPTEVSFTSAWYLPHFAVVKPDKLTSKVRIVFDASAESNGIALNDVIHQGPKLQRELVDVLLRFRKNPVALICDIAEMYLKIQLVPEDRQYFRFLWRDMETTRQPAVFEFNRVVFGVNASPFLAQFVIQEHARANQEVFPMAAQTVLKSTYMDDSLDSVMNDVDGVELYKQLAALWKKAGMHARKWISNSSSVMSEIPPGDRATGMDIKDGGLSTTKTLGVAWSAAADVFTFKVIPAKADFCFTKRNVLKKVATIFDPLGLLGPFTIRAKILMQEMWVGGFEWDDLLPEGLRDKVEAWFGELAILESIQVPRCLRSASETGKMTLHTFVDASQEAYGCVIYSRTAYADKTTSVRIVIAKSRVAPLRQVSIPRLELLAAVLGMQVTESVSNVLEIPLRDAEFWTDSMDVLFWIRGQGRSWKTFVGNRIGEIQASTEPSQWRHIPTKLNPADLISRGMAGGDLAEAELWWHGPKFLTQPPDEWPLKRVELRASSEGLVEKKIDQAPTTFVSLHDALDVWRLEPARFSDWGTLVRRQAWVRRFISNCQRPRRLREKGELTVQELHQSESEIIRKTQREAFPDEYKGLERGSPVSNSKITGLKPMLDEDGVMRSNSRLVYATVLSFDARCPIILPRKHWVTKLIVKNHHEKCHHLGTNQTLASLSTRFWVVSGREAIRQWERECSSCRRIRAKPATQIMAPLTDSRVKMTMRAFSRTAVDYAGPFLTIQGRGKGRQKRYLALFTCLATRAVHLEMAFSMDSDSFLNAFNRMACRRGVPLEVVSDNGGNFIKAEKELRQLVAALDRTRIQKVTAQLGVVWHFNPPLTPHFGGAHEIMVKSVKRAIAATLHNANINDEELQTAFAEAEHLINSRPLTYQAASINDEGPLTPNHFLMGQCGGAFAPGLEDTTNRGLQKRWRRVQELSRHFWKRWLREWLPSLGGRKKWRQESADLQPGAVVLVYNADVARGHWPLGRVQEVFPGRDGHVRVARVQVGEKTLVRPIVKLYPMGCEVDPED